MWRKVEHRIGDWSGGEIGQLVGELPPRNRKPVHWVVWLDIYYFDDAGKVFGIEPDCVVPERHSYIYYETRNMMDFAFGTSLV